MKKGDTRGLSTVIATLLIILLVIVAVAIVWGVIRTIIVNNSQQISTGQFTIDLKIVSIKQNPNDVDVKVKRNPGEGDLEGITFAVFDGENTHVYEKHNVSLNPLETKTFVLDYKGKIVSISIYPTFSTSSGKISTGSIADTYYNLKNNENQSISPDCVPNCSVGAQCGDNGCGGTCGTCSGAKPNCNASGMCTSQPVGSSDCSCSLTTCAGRTCSDNIGGSCFGIIQPNCTDSSGNTIMCGNSTNGCGDCGTCAEGHCDNGICCGEGYHSLPGGGCSKDCSINDCGIRNCGALPERSDCGETFCGVCNTAIGEKCNITTGQCSICQPNCAGKQCGDDGCGGSCGDCSATYGSTFSCNQSTSLCIECQKDCGARQCGSVPNGCGESCGNCTALYNLSYTCNENWLCAMCVPNCGTRTCGPVPNGCGESCGTCNETAGEWCNDGSCYSEHSLNSGTIFSVWPLPIGKMYFDSENLPKSGVNYAGYYAKFPGSDEKRCLQIWEFVIPVFPPYDKSYIRLVATSTEIQAGDSYEIWETYKGCCSGNYC
jgi:hypothetical protein